MTVTMDAAETPDKAAARPPSVDNRRNAKALAGATPQARGLGLGGVCAKPVEFGRQLPRGGVLCSSSAPSGKGLPAGITKSMCYHSRHPKRCLVQGNSHFLAHTSAAGDRSPTATSSVLGLTICLGPSVASWRPARRSRRDEGGNRRRAHSPTRRFGFMRPLGRGPVACLPPASTPMGTPSRGQRLPIRANGCRQTF
jgi:hypothetical protein